jgi:hypothetical protein
VTMITVACTLMDVVGYRYMAGDIDRYMDSTRRTRIGRARQDCLLYSTLLYSTLLSDRLPSTSMRKDAAGRTGA